MISTGTTSYSDMYFEPHTAVKNAIAAGIKSNISRPVQCFDPQERYEQSFRSKESIELFRAYHGAAEDRIRIDFAIHAEYTNQPQIVEAYSADCKALGGRMQLHLSETEKEHRECLEKYGKTPAQWFDSLGTFDSPCAAAHCVWVTEEDMDLMKAKGVSVIHNPTSNLKLGSGFAPIPTMLVLLGGPLVLLDQPDLVGLCLHLQNTSFQLQGAVLSHGDHLRRLAHARELHQVALLDRAAGLRDRLRMKLPFRHGRLRLVQLPEHFCPGLVSVLHPLRLGLGLPHGGKLRKDLVRRGAEISRFVVLFIPFWRGRLKTSIEVQGLEAPLQLGQGEALRRH